MPAALLRPCAAPGGCAELVESGYCPRHAAYARRAPTRARQRESTDARGYGANWRHFRDWVSRRMVELGILPVCGATLPGGPPAAMSRCHAQGRLEARGLQLHHEPPLRPEERHDRRAVCDPRRVVWLCASCHSAETTRRGWR